MTPEQIEQERAAFEAWAKSAFIHINLTLVTKKDGTSEYAGKAARHMFEGWLARAGQGGWISVEDKVPEADTLVLAIDRNNPEVGLFALVDFGGDDLRWSAVIIESVCPVDDLSITHWQPLAHPPAGGAK